MSEKEYIARQEALSELKSGFFPQDVVYTEAVSIAEQILRAAPAADVVAVVRCKDCKCCREEILHGRKTGDFICSHEHWQDAEGWSRYVKPEDYCSYGERKDQNG